MKTSGITSNPTSRTSQASLKQLMGSRGMRTTVPAQLRTPALARHFNTINNHRYSVNVAAVASPVSPATKPAPKDLHGFELVEEQYIAEYDSQALLYRHKKTGAQLISVINTDENKTFGVTFRTPVANSKGTPHILEHSVLCGSRKYPIKEPFVELMKGSLNTFLNAFTYPDRTCYPVASANLQDFYNLVDVYLDAVLHPNCIKDPKIFAQEGWHYEIENTEDPLTFKGVVFNEMKGVYSSPDAVNGRLTQNALFPDNTYAKDSGGDPQVIPDLTFEEFKGFYEAYYHPSNARFWFYGDDPSEDRLQILDAYLNEFDARPVDSSVGAQPLFNEPRKIVDRYAAGDDEGAEEAKAFVSVNWVLSEGPLDLETELALGFLNYLMLGTSASPLRKALNDSGLGESIIGGGVEDELRQPVFSIGLKGVKEEDTAKVEELIFDALAALRKTGFSQSAIEAAINTIEFSLRENNTGRFPRGLSLMLRSMSAWIYDKDPFQPMKWKDDLEHFKGRLAAGEDVFGPLIEKFLLKNTHRVTIELKPDATLGEEIEKTEQQRLESVRQSLKTNDLEALTKETVELKERQETPDPPEALSCVPTLKLSDIPKNITTIASTIDSNRSDGVTTLTHDIFTNDVLYLDVALDMKSVPADLLPLVPLFCRCLTQMGTEKESFIDLTERIGRKTGGLSVSPFVSSIKGKSEPTAYVMVRGKAMADKAGDMLEIARDILLTARLDDKDRFRQMVLETKSGLESGLIGSGHSFAGSRLDAQRSVAGWVSELMGGISYLEYIRALASRLDSDWEGVKTDLESICGALLQTKGALVNMTGDESTLTRTSGPLNEFLSALPSTAATSGGAWSGVLTPTNEALLVPTQVNYVCKAANLYEDAGYKLNGSSYVINKFLGTTWLWDRVRVSGGAYGGFCDFDTHSGMFTYSSYRDPNLLKTVDVYDGTVDFLKDVHLTEEELTKAIIGTIGDIDAYQLPDSKGRTAFMRHILGVNDSERQQRRDEVLATSTKDFKAFADALAEVRAKGKVVAVTSGERLEAAHKERPGFFESVKRML